MAVIGLWWTLLVLGIVLAIVSALVFETYRDRAVLYNDGNLRGAGGYIAMALTFAGMVLFAVSLIVLFNLHQNL